MSSEEQSTGRHKRYCLVPFCTNFSGKVVDGKVITLHPLPDKDRKVIRSKWIKTLKNFWEGMPISANTHICSAHFPDHNVHDKAIPQFFPPNPMSQSTSSSRFNHTVTNDTEPDVEPLRIFPMEEQSVSQSSVLSSSSHAQDLSVAMDSNLNPSLVQQNISSQEANLLEPEPSEWVVLNNELVPKSFLNRSTIPSNWFINSQADSETGDKPTRWCFVNGTVAAYTPDDVDELNPGVVLPQFHMEGEPEDSECDQNLHGQGQVTPAEKQPKRSTRFTRKVQTPQWLKTYATNLTPLRKTSNKIVQGSNKNDQTPQKQEITSPPENLPIIGDIFHAEQAEILHENAVDTLSTTIKTEPETDGYEQYLYGSNGTRFEIGTLTPQSYVTSPDLNQTKKRPKRNVQTPQWLKTYNTAIQGELKETSDSYDSATVKSESVASEEYDGMGVTVKSEPVEYNDEYHATDSGIELKEEVKEAEEEVCIQRPQKQIKHLPKKNQPHKQLKKKPKKVKRKWRVKYATKHVPNQFATVLERKFLRRVQKPQWLETYDSNIRPLRKFEENSSYKRATRRSQTHEKLDPGSNLKPLRKREENSSDLKVPKKLQNHGNPGLDSNIKPLRKLEENSSGHKTPKKVQKAGKAGVDSEFEPRKKVEENSLDHGVTKKSPKQCKPGCVEGQDTSDVGKVDLKDEPSPVNEELESSGTKNKVTQEKIFQTKNITCKHCATAFTLSSSLYRHLKKSCPVLKRSPGFLCKICKKLFMTSSDLKRHLIVVHKKEKPFKCPQCNTRFTHKEDVTKHLVMHKPHRCGMCNAGFGRKDALIQHVHRTHIGFRRQ